MHIVSQMFYLYITSENSSEPILKLTIKKCRKQSSIDLVCIHLVNTMSNISYNS